MTYLRTFIAIAVAAILFYTVSATTQLDVPAIFVFGDSTVDPGNNDYINGTYVRGNHVPYGHDFPKGVPTGRFSNGRLVPDILSSYLGIKQFIPAYLDPAVKDEDLMTGTSFASAGSGIDDESSVHNHVLNLEAQVRNFKMALRRIKQHAGLQEAKRIVEKAVFVFSCGTNDVIFNFYWLPVSHRKLQFSLSQYHDYLLERLHSIIKDLYGLGARKFLVAGMPPTGCLPVQITMKSIFGRKCVEQQNMDSQAYNAKLQGLLSRMSSEVVEAKFAYADIYGSLMDMIQNPSKEGFDVTNEGCCGLTGTVELGPFCWVLSPKCVDTSRYVFWDAIHPSEAAYSRITDDIIKTALPKLVL